MVRELIRRLGPRAEFYYSTLKTLAGLKKPDAETVGLSRAIELMKAHKGDLRKIHPDAFEGLKPTGTMKVPRAWDNPDEYPILSYSVDTENISIPETLVSRNFGPGTTPPVEMFTEVPSIAHEIGHRLQHKEYGSSLRNLVRQGNPAIIDLIENDADTFASFVRLRSEGALRRSDIPDNYQWKKYILSLASALGLGYLFDGDEAEAGVISKIGKKLVGKKAMQKIAGAAASSAEERLIGRELEGKIISGVKKGRGDMRMIQFEDGSVLPVSKDYINSLCRHYGTVDRVQSLKQIDEPSQLSLALRSLEYHRSRQKPMYTKSNKEFFVKNYQEKLKQLGLQPVEYVWVESERLFMPKEYAEILEDAGVVQIKKSRGK